MEHQAFTRYLTRTEERDLLRTVRAYADVYSRRDAAWMLLMLRTGARIGSVAGLTVSDAYDARRTSYLAFRQAKGGRTYSVYLRKDARRALDTLMKIRREMGAAEEPDAALILSRHHKPMSRRSFQHRVKHWARRAGLSHRVTPHWFRHTLGKRLMETSVAQDPRGIAQQALGHRSIASTAIYTRPDREQVEAALEQI